MYADQIVAGVKRSVKDRLDGGEFGREFDRGRHQTVGVKRQRQESVTDDKWKHDLYQDEGPRASKSSAGVRDLRHTLEKKARQQSYQGLKSSSVRDLREKLSGTMHPQPANADPSKPKQSQVKEDAKAVSKNNAPVPVVESKKSTNPTSSKKKSSRKDENTVQGLLQSLGLEKYSITFLAEEIDMAALTHMTDEDLKALGIPMGPRKKILLALEAKS